jgi:uncharacterized C2H2 Zn-finger protein
VTCVGGNGERTAYTRHVNTSHAFDSFENTLKILNVQRKGSHLNTLEKNHIYKTKETGRQLNEVYMDLYDPVLELLV